MKLFFTYFLFVVLICGCASNPQKPQSIVNPSAKSHFFTFGGGYSASGNQVSLEKNIIFLDSILKEASVEPAYKLFADGGQGERSVQFRREDAYPDDFQELVISCIGSTRRINDHYRPHILKGVQGPLKKNEVDKFFSGPASKMTNDEKLIVYYTGHGGKGEKKDVWNTGLYLWHDGVYRMKDFSKKLQSLKVPVVCVMVQCFSGGFQNMVFKDGDPKKGIVSRPLCGFFSTVYNRVAAGCTPQINEANYEEYSTWFWAGIHGSNRLGEKLVQPDYDGNGKVSFDEAHNFTLINLNSIDIPTKTSEAILRAYVSKTSKPLSISNKSTFVEYLKFADPGQKMVLQHFLSSMKLSSSVKISDITKMVKLISEEMKKYKVNYDKQKKVLGSLRIKAGKAIRRFYPELSNPFHPLCRNILVNERDNLKKCLENNKDFNAYKIKRYEIEKMKAASSKMEMKWVRLQRLLLTMQNILFEPYFLRDAKKEVREAYLEIRELEKSYLELSE